MKYKARVDGMRASLVVVVKIKRQSREKRADGVVHSVRAWRADRSSARNSALEREIPG